MKGLKIAYANILPNLAFYSFSYPYKTHHFCPLKIILPKLTFPAHIIPLKWSKKWPKTHILQNIVIWNDM